MITLKTNGGVIIKQKEMVERDVFMEISNINFDFSTYRADIQYYYVNEDTVDGITVTERVDMDSSRVNFTIAEAEAIENGAGGLSGAKHTDKFISLIVAGAMFQLSAMPVYVPASVGWSVHSIA